MEKKGINVILSRMLDCCENAGDLIFVVGRPPQVRMPDGMRPVDVGAEFTKLTP